MESQVYLLSAHEINISNVMADTFRVLFKEKEGHSSTLPSMKVSKPKKRTLTCTSRIKCVFLRIKSIFPTDFAI